MKNGLLPALGLILSLLPTLSATGLQSEEIDTACAKAAGVCRIPDEPWRTIPWQTDLLEAQKIAVEQQKPLFVWAMDGHPLGCT